MSKKIYCKDCRFGDFDDVNEYNKKNDIGKCKRYPPQVFGDVLDYRDDCGAFKVDTVGQSLYPAIKKDDWCGEGEEDLGEK